MNQDRRSLFTRSEDDMDRRKNGQLKPPYITDEGFVLVDRRGVENDDYESRQPDPLDVITIMVPA